MRLDHAIRRAGALLAALVMMLAAPADLELNAAVRADRVTIVKQGRAAASAQASPDGGSAVSVAAPKANGRRTLRKVRADVHIAARLADPPGQARVEGQAAAEGDPSAGK